jgi:hypothetical protein
MFLDFYRKFFILVALLPPDYAEATGAAKKIKIKKQTHHAQKQGKSTGGKNPFCTHPIATAPPVCYNNQAPKGAKEGVFNAEQ